MTEKYEKWEGVYKEMNISGKTEEEIGRALLRNFVGHKWTEYNWTTYNL